MKNIALKKGVCKICGCTANNPCYTPHDGYCWWTDKTESICSHCKYDEIKNNKETVHCINDNPGWKPPKFIDKDGFECDSLAEITTEFETEIICPCCGHKPSTEDYSSIIGAEENECESCGCVYSVEVFHHFSTVCVKYRSDSEGK